MLAINDPRFIRRAEIVWEKGTNRAQFQRGEIGRYEWVDVGSSFLPSDLTAAFLWGQVERLRTIQRKRLGIWQRYRDGLAPLASRGCVQLSALPDYARHNGHMFYLLCRSGRERDRLIAFLRVVGVQAAPHYRDLNNSPYFRHQQDAAPLPNCRRFVDCLVRLPVFYGMDGTTVDRVVAQVLRFYGVSAASRSRGPARRAARGGAT